MLTIKPITMESIDDLGRLLSTDKSADDCWCMWYIIPVKAFHAAGHEGNRAAFCELLARSEAPLGLLAYNQSEPVGWCAVGPKLRYARALKTPTYRGGVEDHDANVWFVPCFFIRRDSRNAGVSRALLEGAVKLAEEHDATAIEGFPFANAQRRPSGDLQVGFQSLFEECGFKVTRTPSPSRVVMRRELKA
jgi:GNAT superfamily N-acetyltransferase